MIWMVFEERYALGGLALWNTGCVVILSYGSILLVNHLSYASKLTIPRGKLEVGGNNLLWYGYVVLQLLGCLGLLG
jgi:hypothetical protein